MKKVLFVLLFAVLRVFAQEDNNTSIFIDEEDGHFDVSKFLASKKGFLPTPILITGPTFGLGGGLNVMFLHSSLSGKKSSIGKYIPPSISGVAAAKTQNGTNAAAAYHLGFYLEGDLRTTSFIGMPDAVLNFYPDNKEFTANVTGQVFYQELKHRVAKSDIFVGLNYQYSSLQAKPDTQVGLVLENIFFKKKQNVALSAVVEYDTRDSIFTPNEGTYFKAVYGWFDSTIGSDFDYNNYRLKAFHYFELGNENVLGLRGEFQAIDGKAPFYLYPSIMLRGMQHQRYQGEQSSVFEVEWRKEIIHRHSTVLFAGAGKAYGSSFERNIKDDENFSNASWHGTYGIGYRYKLARHFKLYAGFDIAKSEDETGFYITVGSAWNAFY
jgi:hypothetical protein